MVYTYAQFTEIVKFAGELIYKGFLTFQNTAIFSDGGVTISLLDIMVGFLAAYLILDRIMVYMSGD